MTDPTALPNLPGLGSPSGPTPPVEAPLRDRLIAALKDLELEPTIDEDGDITFVHQEQQLFIRASDDDSQIIRVFGQWRLAEPVPSGRAERLEVCNDVNVAFNMIKTALAEDTLLVTSEHLLPRGADLRSLLGVVIPLVLHAVGLWHERAVGGNPAVEPPQDPNGPGSAFGLNGNGPGGPGAPGAPGLA